MPDPSVSTTADLRQRIHDLGPWFHNFELEGIRTAPEHFLGDYPRIKWQQFADALPADLSGRRVLDIGCNAGFYCIELKRRGADRVLGIDHDERYLEQARFAARTLGYGDIEFRRLSIYRVHELRERFDLVLFMGALYHLRHPLLALDLIREFVVDDLLVFQSMLRGDASAPPLARDYPFAERAIFDAPGYPRLHFVEHKYAGDPTNWWIPNKACAAALLRAAGFSIVANPEEEVFICRVAEEATPWRREELGAVLGRMP
jgi:tRNA (mo5U34)-methyltransferase